MAIELLGTVVGGDRRTLSLRYGRGNMILKIPKKYVVEVGEDKVVVDESVVKENPWVEVALELGDAEYFMPRKLEDGLYEGFVEVYRKSNDTFLGLRAVIDRDGRMVRVVGVGEYRRVGVGVLPEYREILPAVKVRDYKELPPGEVKLLLENCQGECFEAIYRFDEWLGRLLLHYLVAVDPLSLVTVISPDTLREALQGADKVDVFDEPYPTPAMMEILLAEAEQKRPTLKELHDFIKAKMEKVKRAAEEDKRIVKNAVEDAASVLLLTLDDYMQMERREGRSSEQVIRLLEMIGVETPLVVYGVALPPPPEGGKRKAKGTAGEKAGTP